MKSVYRRVNGEEILNGHCVVPDHYELTFSVTIRSLTPISAEVLKDLIQRKHEVLNSSLEKTVCVVR